MIAEQRTIQRPVRFSHRGLRSGRPAGIRLRPGGAGTGIVFNGTVPARLENAFVEEHAVGLRRNGETVIGVEHLLAACYGLGVDNLQVEVTGGEIPFGDGSARPFIRLLQAAGRRRCRTRRCIQSLQRPVAAWDEDSFICALPGGPADEGGGLEVVCLIRFPDRAIGEQCFSGRITDSGFADELGAARTFGYWRQEQPLPAWLGPVVRAEDGMILPARPRFPDEAVRHKVLDVLGDLCLLARRLQARVFAYKSGHALHRELLRQLEVEWT
jgi:UDP-3-O-[3-hydroxymyristoyl] N-acetylglucosamine deacetylase